MAAPTPPSLTPDQTARFDEDRGPAVIGVSATFISLCTIAVGLRFFARFKRRVSIELDDWLAVGSLIFTILYCVSCVLAVPYGMGRHAWAADPTQAWRILQVGLFNALIYFISHWFIKMSILAFYRRVFTFHILWFKYGVIAVGIYTTAWLISSFFAGLFQCFPPAFFWEQYNPSLNPPPKGSCGAANAPLVIATSALNTAGDVFVFSLPIAMLSRLQLNRANKISLFGVFATGAFAIAAGIVRLVATLSATDLNADTTWVTAYIYMWTAIEAGVGLICACMPIMGPLFGLATKRMTQAASRSSRSGKSQREKSKSSNSSSTRNPATGLQRNVVCDRASADDLELDLQNPQAIVRTDAYFVDTYRRTDDSLDAHLSPGMRANPSSPV